MDDCPRCSAPFATKNAISCACGWKKRAAPKGIEPKVREPVDCAYAGCRNDAILRVQTPTGWANMCKHHDDLYTLGKAKEYTAQHGLKVVGDMRHWIKGREIGKGQMHGAFKEAFERNKPGRLSVRERVPGEDDEEVREVAHAD